MNHRTKFDAASFILAEEICNRTNKQTKTVTDISTPCLSARVDKKMGETDVKTDGRTPDRCRVLTARRGQR